MSDWFATVDLRWIYKDGRYVLQQLWSKLTANGRQDEWRDVPTADDTKP